MNWYTEVLLTSVTSRIDIDRHFDQILDGNFLKILINKFNRLKLIGLITVLKAVAYGIRK